MKIEVSKDFEKYCAEHIRTHYAFYQNNKKGGLTCYCTHCKKIHYLKDSAIFKPKLEENCCTSYYIKPTNYCPNCNVQIEYKSASCENRSINRVEQFNEGYFVKDGKNVKLIVVRVFADFSSETKELRRKPKLYFNNFLTYEFTPTSVAMYRDEWHNMGGRSMFYDGIHFIKKIGYYEDFYIWDKTLEALVNSDLSFFNNLIIQYCRRFTDGRLTEKVPLLMCKMIKRPALRHLWKLGFCELIKELVDESRRRHFINLRGKTIPKILKCELSQLQKFDIYNISENDIEYISQMINFKIPLTQTNLKVFEALNNYGSFIYKTSIFFKYSNMRAFIKYMSKQTARAGDYFDYLKECETLKYNLNERIILFPPDLNDAHARTSAAVTYTQNQEKAKKFELAVKKWLKLDYTSDKYSIKCIESSEELVREGKLMNNCSGGYVDRIACGKCVIFTIRQLANPDEPFCMLELSCENKKVIQCRGIKNTSPPKDVDDFVQNWLNNKISKTEKRAQEQQNIAITA